MTVTGKPTNQPDLKNYSRHPEGKLDPVLGRIDLLAILTALLGGCLLGIAVVVMAVIELARLVASLWSDSFDRWLILVLAAAIVWVAVRWKRLCVF